MTSLALALLCCSSLAAIFKLVGFGTSGVMGSQVSVQISSILSSRLNSLRFVCERPGEAEREWLVGREGGVLPKLKMAAASAAPRNLTSGFGAAGAARLALAPAYGLGVRQRGASWKRPDWEAALGAGSASTPRLLATDLAGIVSESEETLRGKCLCPHPSPFPHLPCLGVEK